jgi:sec-independent protein translocase protein TatB
MIDFGLDKIALIGAVALIVIGPEKLPKVARTVGHLFGKAQRYVADVKAEVNRSIELDELKKMKSQFEDAARNVESTVRNEVNAASAALQGGWNDASAAYSADGSTPALADGSTATDAWVPPAPPPPTYTRPKKNWRLKRGSTPNWYKQRQGIRAKVQSGAARVARFRPAGQKPGR